MKTQKQTGAADSAQPATEIVITLDGGLVQEVFCTHSNARVTVIDFDTDGADPDDLATVKLEDGSETAADVREPICEPMPAHLLAFVAGRQG